MTDTVFSPGVVVASTWLNDVNDATYHKLAQSVSVLNYIPVAQHAAIFNYTSTFDCTTAFNTAIAAAPIVIVPAGGYFITQPINMSGRRIANTYQGRHLIGAGAGITQINAYTGNYPCIDATGQNVGLISGINFRSDNPSIFGKIPADCASNGLIMGRGATTPSCNQLQVIDVRFNMTSDMTRNGGQGTIGIINDSSEHVIMDQIQIYANQPMVIQNVLQFSPIRSSSLPVVGINYEVNYSSSPISCTIHEYRNMQLISWDSFRALNLWQIAGITFTNLYTSTRKLLSSTPAFNETIFIDGSTANITLDCYQEVSGLFGATYRMDHRYLTIGGFNENLNIKIQRGALDQGFNIPGSPVESIRVLATGRIANSDINVNYLDGIYNSSGDNNGFATLPIVLTGVPAGFFNSKFTLDHSGAHSSAIFSAIGQYCTNVLSVNYRSGDTRRCDGINGLPGVFVPVAIGLTSTGVGTYTLQTGFFERFGGWCGINLSMAWSAHTGTGGLAITGLPYTSDTTVEQSLSINYNGLIVGAGKQLTATIPNNQSRIILNQADPAGGALLGVQVDGVVAALTITGCYKVTD